jgi:cytochrome c biogenesis protein CcmG/thiol:disulfide interchange protein DsbE
MRNVLPLLLALIVVGTACSSSPPATDVAAPEEVTSEEFRDVLLDSEDPIVLNVWASWCIPCRSEAPLLSRAAGTFDDEVRFVGLDVRDTPSGAAAFIAEFYANSPIEHYADPGGQIPIDLGGNRGVPLTFFYAPGGELVHMHPGIIDERTLALQIDELLAR